MINWNAELGQVPYYERVHLAKGVAIVLFATAVIASLVYVSTHPALSRTFKIRSKILSCFALSTLLFFLGKRWLKDPLTRSEALCLAHYLEERERLILSPEEGGAQFGAGERVSIPLLRFRRNFAYMILLVGSLAILAITGCILSLRQKVGFAHLNAPNLAGIGTSLALFTIGFGILNRGLTLLRAPHFTPPVTPDNRPLVVRTLEAHSLIYAMNHLRRIQFQLHNIMQPGNITPQLAQVDENLVTCFEASISTLRSEEFSSQALSSENLTNTYQSVLTYFDGSFNFWQEQYSAIFEGLQRNPSFTIMHFLRSIHTLEQEELIIEESLPKIYGSFFIHILDKGTFLELSCILIVGAPYFIHGKIFKVQEYYLNKKATTCKSIETAICDASLLPNRVSILCAEYLLPDWDLLPENDRLWIHSLPERAILDELPHLTVEEIKRAYFLS